MRVGRAAGPADGLLAFVAHAPVKSTNLRHARWSLRTSEAGLKSESRPLADGLFMFEAYWQATAVEAQLAPTTPWGYSLCVGNASSMAVHVWDEWGAETAADVACDTAGYDADPSESGDDAAVAAAGEDDAAVAAAGEDDALAPAV